MNHVIVTRFSVPRPQDPARAHCHADRQWLRGRLDLFRTYFVPSIERLGLPAILLCSSGSALFIEEQTRDLNWVEVVVQDDWYGGWCGSSDQIVTRMDSDDAIHKGWLAAVKAAPTGAEVCCTRNFLRYDILAGKLCAYSRREPSPLAAFKGGRNPFAHARRGTAVASPSSASRITASVESSLMAHPEQVIE